MKDFESKSEPRGFEKLRQIAKRLETETEFASNTPFASKSELPATLPANEVDLPANLPANETDLLASRQIEIASKQPIASKSSLPAKGQCPSLLVPKVTVRIPEDLQDELRLLMLAKNESFQGIILLAIRHLLASEQLPANEDLPAVGSMMIDDIKSKSTSSIIPAQESLSYYEKHTGNEAKERDRQTARSLAGFQGAAIKAGILLSTMRAAAAGTKINSLKYCIGAIQEAATTGVSDSYVTWLEMKKVKTLS